MATFTRDIGDIEDIACAPDLYADGVGAVYRVSGENFCQIWVTWVPSGNGQLIRRKVVGITRPIASLMTQNGQIATLLQETGTVHPPRQVVIKH